MLDFSTFDFQHKSSEISKILQKKLIELNIAHKVTRVTTDGAPNMVKAINNLGLNVERFWCFAHRLHLTIVNAFGFWTTTKDDDQGNLLEKEGKDRCLIFSSMILSELERMRTTF